MWSGGGIHGKCLFMFSFAAKANIFAAFTLIFSMEVVLLLWSLTIAGAHSGPFLPLLMCVGKVAFTLLSHAVARLDYCH